LWRRDGSKVTLGDRWGRNGTYSLKRIWRLRGHQTGDFRREKETILNHTMLQASPIKWKVVQVRDPNDFLSLLIRGVELKQQSRRLCLPHAQKTAILLPLQTGLQLSPMHLQALILLRRQGVSVALASNRVANLAEDRNLAQ